MDAKTMSAGLDALYNEDRAQEIPSYHADWLQRAAESKDMPLCLAVMNEQIGYYRSTGNTSDAVRISSDALALAEQMQLDHDFTYATVLINAATAYCEDRQFDMAFHLYQSAKYILQENSSATYEKAALFNNMGNAMGKAGKTQECIECLQIALNIILSIPDSITEQAISHAGLAAALLSADRIPEAESHLKESLLLFEENGNTSVHYPSALAAFAQLCLKKNDPVQALSYYQKAAEITERYFGRCIDYAILCHNCAHVCEILGQSAEASSYSELFEQTLDSLRIR